MKHSAPDYMEEDSVNFTSDGNASEKENHPDSQPADDKNKKLGIWMDHSCAHLTEFIVHPPETKNIHSTFTHHEKEKSLSKSESLMHNKEQHQQGEYYKILGESIKNYNEVILFGPTDAKTELLNILRADHHFDHIKIETEQSDKMTENQQHAFVRDYFTHETNN